MIEVAETEINNLLVNKLISHNIKYDKKCIKSNSSLINYYHSFSSIYQTFFISEKNSLGECNKGNIKYTRKISNFKFCATKNDT